MTGPNWNERYEQEDLPWDTGVPDRHLVQLVKNDGLKPGRLLEVGCGTGTNSIWLARQGFEVVGLDVSPKAIERARSKLEPGLSCRFEVLNFLEDDVEGAPFETIFDRGCFHIFEEETDQARFAARVAELLKPDGRWVSLIGSTEGPARDSGPPRRSLREVIAAIEPALMIVEVQATTFEKSENESAEAWLCIAQKREVPAQPSTRWADR